MHAILEPSLNRKPFKLIIHSRRHLYITSLHRIAIFRSNPALILCPAKGSREAHFQPSGDFVVEECVVTL